MSPISQSRALHIVLTWNESSLLYDQMLRTSVWSEVEIRMPDDDDEFQEQFGCSREDVDGAKDDIIEELLPDFQDISEDRVYDVIEKLCG